MSTRDAWLPVSGFLFLSIAMSIAWARQRRTRNAGIVDVVWAGGLGGLALFHATCASGWPGRRWIVALLAGVWSLRLTMHLVARVRREAEDGRYADMRRTLGERFDGRMFFFFQAQALLAALLSLVYWIPSTASDAGFAPRDWIALGIACIALAGEALADRELRAWRSDPSNKGRTCRAGLWRYSRHPNYFFEWLQWCAYPVLSIGLPLGWITWFAPALMLFLVLKVTGIPPTEAQALRSRGADYRDYQRTTNAFFPGPPRSSAEQVSIPS